MTAPSHRLRLQPGSLRPPASVESRDARPQGVAGAPARPAQGERRHPDAAPQAGGDDAERVPARGLRAEGRRPRRRRCRRRRSQDLEPPLNRSSRSTATSARRATQSSTISTISCARPARRSDFLQPLSRLRWISFGHWEADESGTMNEWLTVAPHAQVAVGTIGCMISVNDLALRPPKPLDDGAVLDLGGKQVRYVATPHVPHCWDAGVIVEETTHTLCCGDLFTRVGKSPALSAEDPIGPALAAEDVFRATALTPNTAPTIRRLAQLKPQLLALMHGPAYHGDCERALLDLADCYAARLQQAGS